MTFGPDPYYAVIFSAQRTQCDDGYSQMASRLEKLAETMPGYLGIASARNDDGFGITVSYWRSKKDIARWKQQADHLEAQRRGRRDWYEEFDVRIAKVERSYSNQSGDR